MVGLESIADYVRLGGIRYEVNALNGENVLVVGLGAELKGRVAGDLEILVDGDLVAAAKVEAKARLGDTGQERDKCT